jgi:transposase-like protein
MAQTRRKFDDDFREGAVRQVRETGQPIAQVARDLGINARTLGNWVNADERIQGNGAGVLDEGTSAELVHLLPKNAESAVRPAEPTVGPAEPAVERAEPAVEPAQPAVEPAQPAVEPAAPAVEPGESAVERGGLKRLRGFTTTLTRARSIPRLSPFMLTLGYCALPLAALAVGLLSLTTARESATGQYGLIQALPPLYFGSLIILAISFILAWRSPQPRSPALILGVICLVVLLQSAPAIIESEPRFSSAWLVAGFTDFIAHTGRVIPIDARFSWPSFLTGMALLDRAAGLPSAIILLRWWPVFINLLYLPPLYMLAKLVLRDEKKAMLAIWLFPLANWVGQDYYSPQSVAYLLYLVLLCVVLGPYGASRKAMIPRLRGKPGGNGQKKPPDGWRPQAPAYALTLLLVMLVLCAAIDTGHQLTPIFAVATVTVLVFFGRTWLFAWSGVMFLLAFGWICYGAVAFWSGHFTELFGGLGSVGGNYAKDLRLHGDVAHSQINDVRLLIVGAILGLAVIGFFVGRKMRADRTAAAVMMLTPLVTIAGQPYGGEAGLRAFLFSLPGALCLVAMALTSAGLKFRPILIGALTAALVPAFLITRWGNEIFERVLPGEISAMTALYRIAPHGSDIVALSSPVTWQFMAIGQYKYPSAKIIDQPAYRGADGIPSPARLVPGIAGQLRRNPRGGYLIITSSQLESARSVSGLPVSWGVDVERQLGQSKLFRLIYSNSASKIYQVVDAPQAKSTKSTK